MFPYIALLVVILVSVLFTVYKQAEAFEIKGLTITESTPVGTLLDYAKSYLDLNQSLRDKLESSAEFDDTPTEETLKNLGMTYSKMADGSLYYEKPFSKALTVQIAADTGFLAGLLSAIETDLTKGEITRSMTLREFVKKKDPTFPDNQYLDVAPLNAAITNQVKSSNAREAYVKKKTGPSTVAGIPTGDLAGAFGGVKEAIKSSTLSTMQKDTTSTKDMSDNDVAPTVSITMSKEIEDRIAKNVASQVKDSLLVQRATTNLNEMGNGGCPYASYSSTAGEQGTEYTQARPNPQPDMSQYIRKDSIPCWNCAVP